MARGKSGRVVLEINPKLKRDLYLELAKREKTLKDWFVAKAENLVYNGDQINLFEDVDESESRAVNTKRKRGKS